MNYHIFDEYEKRSGETDQECMERVLRSICDSREEEGGSNHGVNDSMKAEFVCCSYEDKSVTLRYKAQQWMANPAGTLHGGMISLAADMTMGVAGRYFKHSRVCVTAQLSVNFLRGILIGSEFDVTAKVTKMGRRAIFLSAEFVNLSDESTSATAAAVFM